MMSPGWSTSVQMLSQVARLLHHLHRQGLRRTGLTEALNEIQSCVRASGKHIRHIRHYEWFGLRTECLCRMHARLGS